jgi:hypothetical protein
VKTICSAALAISLLGATAAWAQDCSLKQIASLPITTTSERGIAVPVKLNGTDQLMDVSLYNTSTILDRDFVDEQKIQTEDLPTYTIQGNSYVTGEAKLQDFQIGSFDSKNAQLLVVAPRHSPEKTAGSLGLTFLSSFDVELDFGNSRLNLFAHASCPGSEAYWARSYTTAPIAVVSDHTSYDASRILTPMMLDGKSLNAAFGYWDHSLMSVEEASAITGVPVDSLETNQIELHPAPAPNPAVRYFLYPFKELSLGGLALANPSIVVYSRGTCKAHTQWPPLAWDGTDCAPNLSLGASELRKFHLYFAFQEGKVYVTAADAHK